MIRATLLALVACSDSSDDAADAPMDEADTDTDADADADTDADADSDTDADADPTGDTAATEAFTLTSPDLLSSAGDPLAAECDWVLPPVFSCSGPNPALEWSGAPAGTVAYALVFDDPVAGFFDHWAIYNIPGSETGLAQGISGENVSPHVLPPGAVELQNGFGYTGYLGSCPPTAHVYRWRLWALDQPITPTDATFGAVEAAAAASALDVATLCHIYRP